MEDDPETFSEAGPNLLRSYQANCARAIAHSVHHGLGKIFTVMFARQMGKNETSAILEAYLLNHYAEKGGTIVKAAPSFKPQVVTSMLRLKQTLDQHPDTQGKWSPAFGYMFRVGQASITFLSANPTANVVGTTASLLLEIDEAQDVDPEKYDREFRPMASSTNATTVLYGTAWNEDSLLERQRRLNLKLEAEGHSEGTRLHFEYDWRVLAEFNPHYKAFVEAEITRLGEDHPSIQTQYFLRCQSDGGRLFSKQQQEAMRGTHSREREPLPGAVYVAGIDLAGEDEQAEDAVARMLSPRRDSTVVTIAEVRRDGTGQAVARVVDHVWWTGRDQVWQYESLLELWRKWNFARVCVDASGIGAGVAAFLAARYPERTEEFVFTSPAKSRLAYQMLAMINTGRLSLYKEEGSSAWRECWQEIGACRYWLRSAEQMGWGVPEREGHDDFVAILALACRAAEELSPPPLGSLIRARRDEEGMGW